MFNLFKRFTYRTKDGKAYFQFSYPKVTKNGRTFYEVDIHKTPSYGRVNASSHVAHWLYSERSVEKKICFSVGKEPKTLDRAKKYSCDWAELTWHYIKTGITIDQQIRQRN